MGDAADETETDEPDDLPETQGPAVTVAHAAERLIANQMEAQQAKLAVFRAFCTAFDKTAAQFNSGHELSFAKEFSRGFISYWDDALNGAPTRAGTERMPQIARVKTGWAIRASDREARDLLVERQDDWAARLGAVAVEGFQKWHTYAVADCPRQLTDIWGAAVDYDQAIKEEIKLQTGAEPIDVHIAKRYSESSDQPTVTMIVSFQAAIQRRWRLFGTSRLARLIAKTARPRTCRRCGGKDHRDNDCKQPERRTIRVLQANVAKIGAYHSIALRLAEAENYDVVLIQEPNVWIEKKAEPAGPRRTAPSTHSPQNAPGNRIRPESDLQDVPERCLIAGDFNACHFSWQPGARSARNGKDIAHLCQYPSADALIEEHLHTGSDHYTISITLPGGFPKDDS
ncbi:endonuclease-reverse transcriptase domain-containing protein [Hirsutella rhossiliensis]